MAHLFNLNSSRMIFKKKEKQFFGLRGKEECVWFDFQTVIWLSHESSSTCPQDIKEKESSNKT